MATGSSASLLFESAVCVEWRKALDLYSEAVQLVAEQKQKGKGKLLAELDNWFQKRLPAIVASRARPHLTHQELCELMKWKLTRGKFRPRLTELVQQNTPEDVETVTASAISHLPDLEKAISTAAKLKAVGPATASAILCAASPQVPFMADEPVQAVLGLGKLNYSLQQYMSYARTVQQKAQQLTEGGKGSWTAHQVELALWAVHHCSRLQPNGSVLGKRGRESREDAVPEPNQGDLDLPAKKHQPPHSDLRSPTP